MLSEITADVSTISLVLLAALLHASWNALAKASDDALVNIAVVTGTGGLVSIPALVFFPLPGPDTWTWLGLSAFIHYAYQLALVRMYQLGDLSQVYPIARGLAPLGVGVLAAVGAGEVMTPTQLLGLLLATVSIIALSGFGSRRASSRRAVVVATFTAVLIGLYTFSDGRGVRSVEEPLSYIGWSFFLGSVPMVLTTIAVRGREGLVSLRAGGLHALGGGLMATLGYGIVLWAMSRATMASVASLRESSVLFAAILGTRFLGEPFGRRRVIAALTLVVGLVLIQVASRNAG
jgi:drug/metabolite transporter (DMT)-like permease